ncbi:MAG: hypothetical protein RSD29_04095 [Bacilli bacterium]
MDINNILESLKKYSILKKDNSLVSVKNGEGLSFIEAINEAIAIEKSMSFAESIGIKDASYYKKEEALKKIHYYIIFMFDSFIKDENIDINSSFYRRILESVLLGIYSKFVKITGTFILNSRLINFFVSKSLNGEIDKIDEYVLSVESYITYLDYQVEEETKKLLILEALARLKEDKKADKLKLASSIIRIEELDNECSKLLLNIKQ